MSSTPAQVIGCSNATKSVGAAKPLKDATSLVKCAAQPKKQNKSTKKTRAKKKPRHPKLMSTARFNQYIQWVNRTGAAELIEEQLSSDKGGRHRKLKVDVLLAGMMAAFTRYGDVQLKTVHMVLDAELTRPLQAKLGIHPYGGAKLNYWQITYLVAAFARLFEDPESPKPDYEDKEGMVQSVNAKHRELEEFTSLLLSGASKHVPHTGAYAIDSTGIASPARPCSRGATPLDRSAAHGYKTATHDQPTEQVYGYHAHMAVRMGAVNGPKPPAIVDHLSLTPANMSEAAPTLAMIDRANANSKPVTEITVDRGFSFGRVENWAQPLHNRSIAQVIDMHKGDKRIAVNAEKGYIMIDGHPHCMHTPKPLHKLQRPAIREESAAGEVKAMKTFRTKLAERRKYALPVYERHPDKTRYQSLGASGTDTCTACTHAYRTNTGKPAEKNKTITIPVTEQLKFHQTEYWGSPEWEASFGRRSRIEGIFGILKSATAGRLRRGWTRQLSITKITLLIAVVMSAMNLDRLTGWARDNDNTDDPITQINTECRGILEIGVDVEFNEFTRRIEPIT